MALFNSLEIGKRALIAQRFGLDVTSNNIANVNTRGFSRQNAVLTETKPLATSVGLLGTGVAVARVDSVRQEFFDREIRTTISSLSGFNADTELIGRLEAIFSETSDFSLDKTIQEFFAAFSDLALRPESIDKRKSVLNAGNNLAKHFNSISQGIEDLRFDVKNRAEDAVVEINRILNDVAELNRQITIARAQGNDSGLQLSDQRANLLEDLSDFVDIRVTINADNLANVNIGGGTVLTGTSAQTVELRESVDAVSGERDIALVALNGKGDIISTLNPTKGEVGVLSNHYNVTLDSNDSSGGLSIIGELNGLADAIVDKVNTSHATGFGLDDAAGAAPGRNFFDPGSVLVPVTAATMALSADVEGLPRNVAAADAGEEPGNGETARAIADLLQAQDFINDTSVIESYSGLVADIGALGSDAKNGAATIEIVQSQLTAQREAVLGVNLDEEAISLIQFQRAFDASARVINTASEMLSVLVNLGA